MAPITSSIAREPDGEASGPTRPRSAEAAARVQLLTHAGDGRFAPRRRLSECMGNEQPHRPRPKRRRPRGQAPDGTPVVRLDIYATSEGAGARQVPPPEAPTLADTGEHDRRKVELDERERAVASREVELERADATLVARAHGLDEREQALDARESELAQAQSAEADLADVERRRRRLAAQEESLSERTHELQKLEAQVEQREQALAEREAHIRLELDLREDELEGREQALADHEQRLERKENELTAYVGQLQGRLTVVK